MTLKRGHPLLKRKTDLTVYLTNARSKVGLTQDRAGKMIGKDKTFICRLERSAKTPRPHVLRALAGIYDLHPNEVLGKAGYKEFPPLDVLEHPDKAPDTILDTITDHERRELKRYLAFIRLVKS